MNTWPVQDAKARFSEFLKASLTDGPQVVTYHGAQAAVLLPVTEWERLKRNEPTSLKALLLAQATSANSALKTPKRGNLYRRNPVAL